MTILSMTQAAQQAGISRSTLYRCIKRGRLSATAQPDGTRGVDTAELIRVFGPLQGATERSQQDATAQDVALLQARIDALERENQLLRDEVEASREREGKLLDVITQGLLKGPKKKKSR